MASRQQVASQRGANGRGREAARPKPGPTAVLYARVSTPEQERDGFSIPAQVQLLRDYAQQHGITIVKEFIDVETAARAGRTAFGNMMQFLGRQECNAILVEKTDRLYRNIKDWVLVDEFGIDIHFVKETVIVGPESRSGEKFLHGIKF
jgi:site-specific DNA recombinase